MSSLRAPLALAFFLGACGGKAPPASPPAAVDATAVIADTSTVAHPPQSQADAAPSDAAPADTVTPADTTTPEDTALAPEPDTVVPSEEVAVAPSELEPGTAPAGIPKDVIARLGMKTQGCVGLSRSGRQGLFILGDKVELMDLKDLAPAESTQSWPLEGFQALLGSDTSVADALASARLVACKELIAPLTCADPKQVMKSPFVACNEVDDVASVVVPKSVPINVTDGVDVAIEGNLPVHIDTAHEAFHDSLRAVYFADELGTLVVLTNNQENLSTLTAVAAHHLGRPAGTCLARPQGPEVKATPPAFAANAADCLAMTADGKHAAFKMWETSPDDPEKIIPKGAQWFGEGTPPALDLGCLVAPAGCSPEAKAQLTAKATELGLVGCAEARRTITVDGRAVPIMTTRAVPVQFMPSTLSLKTPAGLSTFWTAKSGASITAENEEFERAYQHPRGGPVFVYVAVSVTPTREARVYTLGVDQLGYCAPLPGHLPVDPDAAISASSSAPPGGGYRFDAKLVADADLASAWQPVRPKDGDPAPWIELALDGEETVASVEIGNGFQRKDGNGDLFTANARIAQGTLTFSDGSRETITFAPDQRGLVRFDFAPKKTRTVRLTIDATHKGTRWPNDVAVSELRLFGPR